MLQPDQTSDERLTIACPKPSCDGLLHSTWSHNRPRYSPCTACDAKFHMCTRGENCRNPAGAVQETEAFYMNSGYPRPVCKACSKASAKPKTVQCPAPSCPGELVSEPAGYMHCMVCSADYRSCGAGQKCCSTAGCLQVASGFAEAQAGSKKRIRCKACTEAGAPENAGPKDAACQGTLSEPCAFSGRSILPSTTCTMCTSTFNKQLKAAYSFLRNSLLTEAADGGKKLEFVKVAAPLRPVVTSKTFFPNKDIAFVFNMQTPQDIRATVASLQQKFEEAGGRMRDAIPEGKGKKQPRQASAADRMFWDAPAPNLTACTARWSGAEPWVKGLKGCYYLQRLYVIETSDATAFNYQQHLSSLNRVFGKPDQYIMQAPRESYNDFNGGFQYKFTSIYKMVKSVASQHPIGVILHDGKLQRCLSYDTCPTDEVLKRVLRKQ